MISTYFLLAALGQSFSVVVLPDTQHYSMNDPATFNAQTQWIVDQQASRNIVAVLHEGDLVDAYDDNATQWTRADAAMSLLDSAAVPWLPGIGNHDLVSAFEKRFPPARFVWPGYLHYLDTGAAAVVAEPFGFRFVWITLPWNPQPDHIAWAHAVLAAVPDHAGIVVSHSIITCGGSFSAQGQAIYDGLKDRPNLVLMLCGHEAAGQGRWPAGKCETRRVDIYNTQPVWTLLADYQNLCKTGGSCGCGSACDNGDGWLRLLEFMPHESELHVWTYSPTLGQYQTGPDSEFTLSMNLAMWADPAAMRDALLSGDGIADWNCDGVVNGLDVQAVINAMNGGVR